MVEQWSPKPSVACSSRVSPAITDTLLKGKVFSFRKYFPYSEFFSIVTQKKKNVKLICYNGYRSSTLKSSPQKRAFFQCCTISKHSVYAILAP